MAKLGLLVILEAKPGKEDEVDQFLRGALPLVQQEQGTVSWYALRLANSRFGIFDTFDNEEGRHGACFRQGSGSTFCQGRGAVFSISYD